MSVREIIRQKILQTGPVPFDEFMEMALYYPDFGYYNQARNPIGTEGDYYTMPHLTPVFGAMIARQIKEMWEILGQPKTFTIVEVGAGNGQLCRAIQSEAAQIHGFSNALEYLIVERSPVMRARAKNLVSADVRFLESPDALPVFCGCVLSNELFDNIPFSILKREKDIMEIFVDYDIDFFETLRPVSDSLKPVIAALPDSAFCGSRIEISLQALDCIRQLAVKLNQGFMLTIDYGFTGSDLHASLSQGGSVKCFHKHQRHQNPYIHIGEQDITCQVNFSMLHAFGQVSGLNTAGFVGQGNFLRSLGLLPYLLKLQNTANERAIRFLADQLLGQTNEFKVLVQYKDIPAPKLSGLMLREPVKL